jgi:small subunit ribosomal protein S17
MTENTSAEAHVDGRGVRRTIQGTVTSQKMDKTVVVTVIRRVRDRRFHKFLTRRVKYKAHDETNTYKVGDLVEIVESRPMSRTKRWRVLRLINRPAEVASDDASKSPKGDRAEKA